MATFRINNGPTSASQLQSNDGVTGTGTFQNGDQFNTAMGVNALSSNEGIRHAAFGGGALRDNSTGESNSAFGYVTLLVNTTGDFNSAFGSSSLASNTTGKLNSAFGTSALSSNTDGDFNCAFGTTCLNDLDGTDDNCGFGVGSMRFLTSGTGCCAFGRDSLRANLTSGYNSCFGHECGHAITGANNTIMGSYAGTNGIASTGVADLTSGSDNVILGTDASVHAGTASGCVIIGAGANNGSVVQTTADNQLLIQLGGGLLATDNALMTDLEATNVTGAAWPGANSDPAVDVAGVVNPGATPRSPTDYLTVSLIRPGFGLVTRRIPLYA